MSISKLLPLAVAAAVASLSAIPAQAGTAEGIERSSAANASGRCQGALPAFEGAIRKRPLALQNEGTSGAFVTCTFVADESDVEYYAFGAYARSTSGAAINATCTAVLGWDGDAGVQYSTKTIALPASGAQVLLAWQAADFPNGINRSLINLSCQLPPGAALNDMYLNYLESIPATTPPAP